MGKFKGAELYEKRHIVAKFERIGELNVGGIVMPLWGFVTLISRLDAPIIAAKFDRLAKKDEEGHIRLEDTQPGEIILTPGLIYKKIPMSSPIMRKHEQAMKRWKPKPEFFFEKEKGPVVDLGPVNMPKPHDKIH
jgi:hypothetical protein